MFFAESYGSVIGGGSFLIQPMLIAFGLPPHMAVANSTTSTLGTNFGGLLVFRKFNLVRWNLVLIMVPGMLLGTIIGLYFLTNVSEKFIENFIAIMAIITLTYVLIGNKKLGTDKQELPNNYLITLPIYGVALGTYIAFSGAGAGTFSSLILTAFFGTTFLESIALRKAVHLFPKFISFAGYIYLGLIHWPIMLNMFVACLIGGALGSRVSIIIGDKWLKPVFIVAVAGFSLYLLLK